jgi:hypothetical protein
MPVPAPAATPPAAAGGRGGNGARNEPAVTPRIVVDKQHNELTIPMETEPLEVKLDPNSWVTMMQATFVKK